jgi:uncharacterized membrane protein YccF (DUF307 family)
MKFSLRLLYLYLFSFVGLLITVIGGIQIVDLTLKTYVFKVSEYSYYPEPVAVEGGKPIMSIEESRKRNEEEQINQRKRQLSNSLAMIVIGGPLYLYHWKTIKKEN